MTCLMTIIGALVLAGCRDTDDPVSTATDPFPRIPEEERSDVDALLGYLRSGDAETRTQAVCLLGQEPEMARAALPSIRELLVRFRDDPALQPDAEVLIHIFNLIAVCGSDAAELAPEIGNWLRLASARPDWRGDVGEAALDSLSACGARPEVVAELLLTLQESSDGSLDVASIRRLNDLGPRVELSEATLWELLAALEVHWGKLPADMATDPTPSTLVWVLNRLAGENGELASAAYDWDGLHRRALAAQEQMDDLWDQLRRDPPARYLEIGDREFANEGFVAYQERLLALDDNRAAVREILKLLEHVRSASSDEDEAGTDGSNAGG